MYLFDESRPLGLDELRVCIPRLREVLVEYQAQGCWGTDPASITEWSDEFMVQVMHDAECAVSGTKHLAEEALVNIAQLYGDVGGEVFCTPYMAMRLEEEDQQTLMI